MTRYTEAEYHALLARDVGRGAIRPSRAVALLERARSLLEIVGPLQAPAPFAVTLTLPFPPSVNASLVYGNRSRMLARKVIWGYRAAVCEAVATQWPHGLFRPLNQRLALAIVLYPSNARRWDLDNRVKQIFDALATDGFHSTRPRAAVYLDDSQIDHFSVTRGAVNRHSVPYVTVQITPWP